MQIRVMLHILHKRWFFSFRFPLAYFLLSILKNIFFFLMMDFSDRPQCWRWYNLGATSITYLQSRPFIEATMTASLFTSRHDILSCLLVLLSVSDFASPQFFTYIFATDHASGFTYRHYSSLCHHTFTIYRHKLSRSIYLSIRFSLDWDSATDYFRRFSSKVAIFPRFISRWIWQSNIYKILILIIKRFLIFICLIYFTMRMLICFMPCH